MHMCGHFHFICTQGSRDGTYPLLHNFNLTPILHTEKVWKVARYTSAAPLFFTEMDDYVDGGVLANNPSIDGLATIMSHHRKMGQTLPISLVVSVGTGIICEQRIGSIDAQEVVARWRMEPLMDRLKNLATLLSTAVSALSLLSVIQCVFGFS